jgi:hypothetical protein
MDKNSSNKRGNNVVSRRGGHPQAATSDEVQPMLPATTNTGSGHHHPAPPRSAQFGLPTLSTTTPDEKLDDHHKRRYRVNLPIRMLAVLVMVFLAVPLMVFFYKEVHIHDGHDEAHFKPEKLVNVNTQDVISQFSNHAQEAKHQHEKRNHHGHTGSSKDEENIDHGGNQQENAEKDKSSVDSEDGKDIDVAGELEETEEEPGDDTDGSSNDAAEEKNDSEGEEGDGDDEKEKDADDKDSEDSKDEEGVEEGEGRKTKRIRRRT